MRKPVIILLTAGFISLLLFSMSSVAGQTSASAIETGMIVYALEELGFEEYIAVIASIAEIEEYPHFLEENSQRYEDFQVNNPTMTFDRVIALVNVNADREHYNYIQSVPDASAITVLVNKHFELPEDWEPDDFVDMGGGHLMREEAAEHFILMREAINEAGMNLNVIITYRSFARQRNHFNNAVARLGRSNAEGGNARPGHSEHQTGLAVDVLHRGHDGGLMIDMGFENSRQFSWLVENAHEFGFILRYPRGYRVHHGFMFEPWHWRYVGIPIATKMQIEDIPTYEEFYGRYLAQGVRDKVAEYILEQQRLAEEAAIAEAEAAEAVVRAAEEALAAEQAAIEAQAAAEALALVEELKRASISEAAKTAKDMAALITIKVEELYGNRHFIEVFAVLGISAIVAVTYLIKKKK